MEVVGYTIDAWRDWMNECGVCHEGADYIPDDYVCIGASFDDIHMQRKEKNDKFLDAVDESYGEVVYQSSLGERLIRYDLGKYGEIFYYENERLRKDLHGDSLIFSNKRNYNKLYKQPMNNEYLLNLRSLRIGYTKENGRIQNSI